MQKSKSFILPILGLPSFFNGIVDTYLGNIYYEGEESWGNYLYLCLDPQEVSKPIGSALRNHPQFKEEFHEDEFVFFVFDLTETQKQNIVEPFLEGKYSKIDREYVARSFPKYTAVGTISTNWRILVRDDWEKPNNILPLKDYWEGKINNPEHKKYGLSVSIPDDAEVWSRPLKKDEVYGYGMLEYVGSTDQPTDLLSLD